MFRNDRPFIATGSRRRSVPARVREAKMRSVLAVFCALGLSAVGCTYRGNGDVRTARDEGKGAVKEYAGACERHWERAQDTVSRLGLKVRDENKDAGEIIAKTPAHIFGGKDGGGSGELVGIYLEPARNGSTCKIRVIAMDWNRFEIADSREVDRKFFQSYRPPYVE